MSIVLRSLILPITIVHHNTDTDCSGPSNEGYLEKGRVRTLPEVKSMSIKGNMGSNWRLVNLDQIDVNLMQNSIERSNSTLQAAMIGVLQIKTWQGK